MPRARSLFLATAIVFAVTATPLRAETPPRPQVDFQGEWQIEQTGANLPMASMLMRYSADGAVMAMQMNQEGMEMNSIRYMDTGEMLMWTSAMPGMAMRMTLPEDEVTANAVKTDQRKDIDGESCTVWTVNETEVCLTDDGLPIESRFPGGVARLVNIDRSAQDGASFEPPAGLQIMDMPTGLGGQAMPGQGMGLPF